MASFKFLILAAVATLFALVAEAKSRSRGSSGSGRKGGSSGIGDSYWFFAYTFTNMAWKNTPMDMQPFVQENVRIMWENRPARAQAATCILGAWSVKDYDKVSAAIRVSHFSTSFWGVHKVKIYDCMYLWGPGQQFYSEDDVNTEMMGWSLDDSKCTMDNSTMDITCL